jgi:hypothetical protein
MISEWWIGKDLEGSDRGLILRGCSRIRLEELRKTIRSQSEFPDSRPRFDPGAPEYEAGVLTTQPRLT